MRKAFIGKLAILGPGLLGGSLAGAVRRHQLAEEICVWARRSAAAEAVRARGWADTATTDIAMAVDRARLLILATPIAAMPGLARQIVDAGPPSDCLVTDVGSVKSFVAEKVAPLFDAADLAFVGSHPMAGSEAAGFDAAREDLFHGAACFVVRRSGDSLDAGLMLRRFWELLGGRVIEVDPREHDLVVARISHLPHVAASCLALAALTGREQDALSCGPGFRDTTRIAGGNPELWADILLENREEVITALDGLVGRLRQIRALLEQSDREKLLDVLHEAKRLRDQARDAAPLTHG